MTRKPTGLSAFTAPKREQALPPSPALPVDPPPPAAPSTAKVGKRARGKGETVALTVRVSPADWQRLHQLAMAEGTSLQALALRGFSRLLEEQGLPGVEIA